MTFGLGFCSVLYGVYRVQLGFLAKLGFWFGSFLLVSGSFPSLVNSYRPLLSLSLYFN